ncbi:MAG: hypothetical protein R2748_29195 [Bryobacterales bacterium]
MLIPDGDLRAYLDGEVCETRRSEIESLLAHDSALSRRLEALRESSQWTSGALSSLDDAPSTADTEAALAALSLDGKPARRNLPAWGALAASLLLGALLLTWQPARAAAQRLLGFLRFETVAVLEFDHRQLPKDLSQPQAQMLAQALSETVEEVKKPGPSQQASSREEASAMAHLTARLPAGVIEQPNLTVNDSASFEMTVDLARFEQMLEIIGRSDVQVPAELDQAHVRFDLFESLRARYGNCWEEGAKPSPECFQLVQTRTPSVVSTPEIDLGQIAKLGLEVSGMSSDEAELMTSAIDWTSTLVIPMPKDQARHEEIEVDGGRGVLVTFHRDDVEMQGYGIFWVRNGITYMLTGTGDTGFGLQMANSLE